MGVLQSGRLSEALLTDLLRIYGLFGETQRALSAVSANQVGDQ